MKNAGFIPLLILWIMGGVLIATRPALACYSIDVSASITKLLTNGHTSSITATVTQGDNPVSGHTIQFSVSGLTSPGSVNPTTDDTDGSGNAHTTYTSSSDYGTVTITAKDLDQANQPTDPCTIQVYKISQARRIFWFDGNVSPNDNPGGYDLTSSLTAYGPTGSFSWTITAGSDDARFFDGTTTASGNPVTIKAIDESSQADTVQVKLKTNGLTVSGTCPVTVWGPHHLYRWGRVDGQLNPNGWETAYHYYTRVAWDVDFPNQGQLGINEHWTTALSHAVLFPNYNWGPYAEEVWQNNPNDVQDHLWLQDGNPPWLDPTPVFGDATLVDWQGQEFRMGSTTRYLGVVVKSHTVEGHLGFGRHNPD